MGQVWQESLLFSRFVPWFSQTCR